MTFTSLPMFAALRRFSILMTMFLEFYIIKVRPSTAVQMSVYGMIGGALLAASDDLSFNLEGYTMITLTNIFTAANGVFVKKKLSGSDLGTYGLMFYNSLVMFVPAITVTWLIGDLESAFNFDQWNNPIFVIQFLLSCIMGFVLNYSTVLCTQHNSALTTTIVGCLKNVSITYIGMFIGGDYIFSWLNCIGINVSVFASLIYTYVTFRKKNRRDHGPDREKLLEPSKVESV
jgi:solute carrier family 35